MGSTDRIFTLHNKGYIEPPNGQMQISLTNMKSAQTLMSSAGTSKLKCRASRNSNLMNKSNDVCSQQFRPQSSMSNDLDLLFDPLFDEYFNGENQVVLKSSAVTTTDASNKRQQQPDSTSSTSTLATTVTANGNFDL
ncbi:hypothetical protein Tco_0870971 [Tanacetum coccineum]|uniref:Uncharacterized protein n=1 Tax=Tanacetum coccineum TaxID=301880 RepID=A0ABQ5J871_9ASTR